MKITRGEDKVINVILRGKNIEQVDKFRYLGAWITNDGRMEMEIKARIAMAKEAFCKRKELLTKSFSRTLKKRIVKTLVWSVVQMK